MDTLFRLRRILAAVLLLGMTGTFVELLLLQHDEDAIQILPLALLGTGVAAVRGLMLLFLAAGAAGVYFHFTANLEFQRETDPALRGMPLFRQALAAKVPPPLAPGVMLQLGLIGLAYTYRYKER